VEDLVEAFQRARPAVLEHAKKPAVGATASPPKRKRGEAQVDEVEEGRASKRTRSSSRRTPQSTQASQQPVIIDSEGEGEDASYVPNDGLVECPVCGKPMKLTAVDAHIGRCLAEHDGTSSKPPPKSSISKPGIISSDPVKRPYPMALINYSTTKDTALRKKLSDLGISTGGNRSMMEKRLTEYTTLWNANCDAKNPKSTGQLKKELDIWERTLGSRAPAANTVATQIKDKDFDAAAYATKHNDSFQDLIAKAREKAKKKITDSGTINGTDETGSSVHPPTPAYNSPYPAPKDTGSGERGSDGEIAPILPSSQMTQLEMTLLSQQNGQESSQITYQAQRQFFKENMEEIGDSDEDIKLFEQTPLVNGSAAVGSDLGYS